MDKNFYAKYMEIFLAENSKLNLISKNDEKFLWEKHVFDSLAIEKFFEQYGIANPDGMSLLDIGTGGGFPSIPIAIRYPGIKVTALDSIRKKINAVSEIKNKLDLQNLNAICCRAENLKNNQFDFITSRAVAELKVLIPYAMPLLKDNGYFVVYKSVKAEEEIKNASGVLKKYKAAADSIIEYNLPLEENYTRKLVIIKRV